MKTVSPAGHESAVQLVITAALKKEIPKKWFTAHGVPVHTLSALKSGAMQSPDSSSRGILVVITGPGPENSEEAARWIRDNITPLYVLNIGTCALTHKRYPLGQWIRAAASAGEQGGFRQIDTRLPIPFAVGSIEVDSILSVKKAAAGGVPASWKRHDAIDMECCAQADVFDGTGISYHCLKFSTDYSDEYTIRDFDKNVCLFTEKITDVFSFLEGHEEIHISAVVPVYNRRHTVKRAIDSVLSQSLPPAEVIVVDDASTDGTEEVLTTYGERISTIRLPRNSGPSKARNTGVRAARSGWIAFLDSDDCWEKTRLETQYEYLKRYPFYEILQSGEKWVRNGVRVNPCRHHEKPVGWIWEPSLERCLVSPSAVLIKKTLFQRYGGFNEKLPACEDYDLWLRLSRRHPVGLAPQLSVVKYGGHPDQLSRKYPAMDRFRVESMLHMLENETAAHCREKLIDVLSRKLNILLKGYDKRENIPDGRRCREILGSLERYRKGA